MRLCVQNQFSVNGIKILVTACFVPNSEMALGLHVQRSVSPVSRAADLYWLLIQIPATIKQSALKAY